MLRSRARSSTASSCSSAATAWPKALGSASTRVEEHTPRWGALDQGFWPEGVYTAPTDEALASDLLTLKRLGFEAVRKHQKIEPRRFYYHCDRLGIAVIQDFPGGRGAFGNASVEARFRAELRQMVRRTAAHPSGKIF